MASQGVQQVVYRVLPPKVIGESEAEYQAQIQKDMQQAAERGEVPEGPKKAVVGDCWETA